MSIRDMSELDKTVAWVLGAVHQLSDWGVLPKEIVGLATPAEVALFDQVDAEWKPDDRQIEDICMSVLTHNEKQVLGKDVINLLKRFRDNREAINNIIDKKKGEA